MILQKRYLPFIILSLLALLTALWAGLLRLGWSLPAFQGLAMAHGPLMVGGFLGTLIPLERAVAIRKRWMFVAPALTAFGWVILPTARQWGGFLNEAAILLFLIMTGYAVWKGSRVPLENRQPGHASKFDGNSLP